MSAALEELSYPRFTVQCCRACPLRSNAVAAVVQLMPRHGLTERELSIVRLLAEGLSNPEIGKRLWIAEQTVKFHITGVNRKLRLTNRTAVAVWAVRNGLA